MIFKENNGGLEAEFKFDDFINAFSFLTKVAILAEKHNHHPEIKNVYNTVNLRLLTHDDGDKITEKDHKLAKAIEAL